MAIWLATFSFPVATASQLSAYTSYHSATVKKSIGLSCWKTIVG